MVNRPLSRVRDSRGRAAVSLPYAEGLLALCEFSGCPGIAVDIPAARSRSKSQSAILSPSTAGNARLEAVIHGAG
jgi:hypothetical protein